MSIKIDPSYLRYIHDCLNSGRIHAENASSLPEGLTGLYDSTFLGDLNVKVSQQLLKIFAYFSLLKKEVSCQFVAIALEEPESEIVDFISTYSKWFNSAQSGKFSIYHERLRTFIISAISQNEFEVINNRIISLSQAAISNRSNDEWENYALEYLSIHLFIRSMISGNGDALKKLAYDTTHWNRQIEVSKGFEWSKKMLNEMMQWAAKYDDEEVIECALNKVDLHHMEQHDAPRIVELVANNDIETALQRIEAFGGNDKEGLQRKFILYMLCLMELTLLDSKDKSFRKEAIEKLLRHLDEKKIPEHFLEFDANLFPIYFLFLIIDKLQENKISFNLIELLNKISNQYQPKDRINALFEIIYITKSNLFKERIILKIIQELDSVWYNKEKIEIIKKLTFSYYDIFNKYNGIQIIENITNFYDGPEGELDKINLLICKSYIYYKHNDLKSAIKSLEICEKKSASINLNYIEERITILIEIAKAYYSISFNDKSEKIINEVILFVNQIGHYPNKIEFLLKISNVLFSLGILNNSKKNIEYANELIDKISDVYSQVLSLSSIAFAYLDSGDYENFKINLDRSIKLSQRIIDDQESGTKSWSFMMISERLCLKKEFEIAKKMILDIDNLIERYIAIGNYMVGYYSQNKNLEKPIIIELYFNLSKDFISPDIEENFDGLSGSLDTDYKSSLLKVVSLNFVKKNQINKAILVAQSIKDGNIKNYTLIGILKKISIKKEINDLITLIESVFDEFWFDYIYDALSIHLLRNGKIDKSIQISKFIIDDFAKKSTLHKIAFELAKSNYFEESIKLIRTNQDDFDKSIALTMLSSKFQSQGNTIKSDYYLSKAFRIAKYNQSSSEKDILFKEISIVYALQKKFKKALDLISKIEYDFEKNEAIANLLFQMLLCQNLEECLFVLSNIDRIVDKLFCLLKVSKRLKKAGKKSLSYKLIELSLSYDIEIIKDDIVNVSFALFEIGYYNKSFELIDIYANEKSRADYWNKMSNYIFKSKGIIYWVNFQKQFSEVETSEKFLKGISKEINPILINKKNVIRLAPLFIYNLDFNKKLIQSFVLNQLFFGKQRDIGRYLQKFNCQWAIDIKNSFNENKIGQSVLLQ